MLKHQGFLVPRLVIALVDEIEALDKINKLACIDWAEDHTHLEKLCLKWYPKDKVEGDGYSVPGIMDLADMLDAKITERVEPVG